MSLLPVLLFSLFLPQSLSVSSPLSLSLSISHTHSHSIPLSLRLSVYLGSLSLCLSLSHFCSLSLSLYISLSGSLNSLSPSQSASFTLFRSLSISLCLFFNVSLCLSFLVSTYHSLTSSPVTSKCATHVFWYFQLTLTFKQTITRMSSQPTFKFRFQWAVSPELNWTYDLSHPISWTFLSTLSAGIKLDTTSAKRCK